MQQSENERIHAKAVRNRELSEKTIRFGCLPLIGIAFIAFLFSLFSTDKRGSATETPGVSQSPESTPATVHAILEDTEQFKTRFNKFMGTTNSPLRIRDFEKTIGEENDGAQCFLNDRIGFVCQVNKDKSVRSIIMIGQGDGSLSSGADIMLSIAALITSTNPDISASERGNILKEMGLLQGRTHLDNLDGETSRNGIKYFISMSEQIGVMFGAQSTADK